MGKQIKKKSFENLLKNNKDIFLPCAFYNRFQTENGWRDFELHDKELVYAGMLSENSEEFIFEAWQSFIAAKNEFLKGDKTLREIYQESGNVLGLENYGYINIARDLSRLVLLDENYLNKIDYKGLKSDIEYYSTLRSIQNLRAETEKSALILLRNSVAHNKFRIVFEKGRPVIYFTIGQDRQERTVVMESEGLKKYVDVLYRHIDVEVQKYFEKNEKERAVDFYKKLFKVGSEGKLPNDKQELIEFQHNNKIASKEELNAKINTIFNNFLLTNPDLKLNQIMDMVYEELQKEYHMPRNDIDKNVRFLKNQNPDMKRSDVYKFVKQELKKDDFTNEFQNKQNLRIKRAMLGFVENQQNLSSQDALEEAQYVFATKHFKVLMKRENLSQEICDFLNERFDVAKVVEENKLNMGDNESFHKAFLENIRHSILHDRALIGTNGEIIFKIQNVDGNKKINKIKKDMEKFKNRTPSEYKEKYYEVLKKHDLNDKTLVTVARLNKEDLINLCELIMRSHDSIEQESENERIMSAPLMKKEEKKEVVLLEKKKVTSHDIKRQKNIERKARIEERVKRGVQNQQNEGDCKQKEILYVEEEQEENEL